MIIEIQRKAVAAETNEDRAIAARMPSWLRSDYKLADRTAAENVFAELDARADAQRNLDPPPHHACGCPFGSEKDCPKLSCPGKFARPALLPK